MSILPCSRGFSRAWRRLHVFASNFDWFIALFTPVVIGQSNNFGLVLGHSISIGGNPREQSSSSECRGPR